MRIIFIIVLCLATAFITSCEMEDYEDTLHLVPKNSHTVFNININSYYEENGMDNSEKKFFDDILELAKGVILSKCPDLDISPDKELFPYINPNFSLALYDGGGIIWDFLLEENVNIQEVLKEKTAPFVIVFNINDKNKVK